MANDLITANRELAFQRVERSKRAAELVVANQELAFQRLERGRRAAELEVANRELAFQNEEKGKRAAELVMANRELAFQNSEKEKRAAELILANTELVFQNSEKEKRAAELIVANTELVFQNSEKEKRAAELLIANSELVFQNFQKEARAAELIVANQELAFQNEEKEKRAAELIIANRELAFQNEQKEFRAAELVVANDDLKRAEEQFRLVVESAPNAMVLVNGQGSIVLVNTQTEKLFGYGRDELLGNKIELLMPPQFRGHHPQLRGTFSDAPETRAMGAGRELFARRKDGSDFPVEIGLNPIETANGKVVLASIVDITERKRQDALIKKHTKELEQIVYVASHDLQEPLRTVSNYMEVFEEDYAGQLDESAFTYLRAVNKATKRMSILIRSLLEFSRLGSHRTTSQVDFKKLLAEVTSDLQTLITASGAVIEVGAMPSLSVFEVELRQVFQNLISNAMKFRKKGLAPVVRIRAQQHPDTWELTVSDNGIGIAAQHFERVFDIYQRLHTSGEYEGYGIGLANCKKIINQHRGEIWIESILGVGTTVHFTLPNGP